MEALARGGLKGIRRRFMLGLRMEAAEVRKEQEVAQIETLLAERSDSKRQLQLLERERARLVEQASTPAARHARAAAG